VNKTDKKALPKWIIRRWLSLTVGAAKESRLSAIHDISTSYSAWIQSVAENQDLSRIRDKGLVNYAQLEHEDA
jgi:hypothetical protein